MQQSTCGCSRPRRTVTDFVLNPCRKAGEPLPAASGERIAGRDGVAVRFYAEVAGGRVATVRYEATSCATLIAYAELLGDLVTEQPAAQAARISTRRLVEALPGVPAARRDRAELVIRAWWSALARSIEHAEQRGTTA